MSSKKLRQRQEAAKALLEWTKSVPDPDTGVLAVAVPAADDSLRAARHLVGTCATDPDRVTRIAEHIEHLRALVGKPIQARPARRLANG